jgi:hypothetical protein
MVDGSNQGFSGSSLSGDSDRRVAGIVLVSIGSAIFAVGIIALLIGVYILYTKYSELKAIEGGIESLKDLQNNRL